MPAVSPKDLVTSSFTRAVNAGHAEALARARMQQTKPGNLLIAAAVGKPLSDEDLQRYFEQSRRDYYQAPSEFNKCFILQKREAFKQSVAAAEVSRALVLQDGYQVYREIGYKPDVILDVILGDLDYFERYGKHLPRRFLTKAQMEYAPEKLTDVTAVYEQKKRMIADEVKSLRSGNALIPGNPLMNAPIVGAARTLTYGSFLANFPNKGRWDLQGLPDLPGQKLLRDKNGKPIPYISARKPGRYQSEDLYALYRGKPVRAGYLSNYIVGYASAAAGITPLEPIAAGELYSLYANHKADNPQDVQATIDGYIDYFSEKIKKS